MEQLLFGLLTVVGFGVLLCIAALLFKSQRERESAERKRQFKIPRANPHRWAGKDSDVSSLLSGHEFYIRVDPACARNSLRLISALLEPECPVAWLPGWEYAVVLWSEARVDESLLLYLSGELDTEVIWMAYIKTMDAFEYQLWNRGMLIRGLTYGYRRADRRWESVDGEPQDWEAEVIFSETQLSARLRARYWSGDEKKWITEADSWTTGEREEIIRIWNEHKYNLGGSEPPLEIHGVISLAKSIGRHYQLPGWI